MASFTGNINDLVDLAVSVGGVFVSGVLYYGAVKTCNKFIHTSRAISEISRAENVPISGLRVLLSSKSSESESRSSNEMLVLVSGVLKANSGNASNRAAKSVLLERFRGSISHEERTLSTNSPLILCGSGQEDSNHVRVCLEGSDKLPSLVIFNVAKMFPSYKKVGQKMNAVGICSLQDGDLQIKACNTLPYFLTTSTRDEMIKRLKDCKSIYFNVTLMLTVVSLVVSLEYTIPNVLGLWKKWKHFWNTRRPAIDEE